MQWAIATAAFLASVVEFVEAFTIVLVIGITINWRSTIVGTLAALAVLAVIITIFGVSLIQFVPMDILRLVVGGLLILFGLKWLKKAILRYSGLKALHDEEAIFEEQMAELRARGEQVTRLQPIGIALAFKAVFLEGLEVALIVILFGSNATAACSSNCGIGGIASAAIGAGLALFLVLIVGMLVRGPLTRVPENTLKFTVGLMLVVFGVFWTIEGFGIEWPLDDLSLLLLAGIYGLASFLFVFWLKQRKTQPLITDQMIPAQEGHQE